ncbi:MAG: hypothetical protein FH758_09825 [Firmicutes bacterium]|nr:hypothetical protein [Bacillota bacterium]
MKLWKNKFVGVDISAAKVKVAQLKMNKSTPIIQQLAQKVLNTPLSSMGVDELAAALKELLTGINYKNGIITASLPAEELILKLVPVPVMDKEELETAMCFEGEAMVSGETDQWVIRHIPLFNGAEGAVVLLVAAPRQLTLLIYEAFKILGIKLHGIDIQPFALWRVSKLWRDTTSCTAMLNVDDKSGQLIVVNNGYIKFARILAADTDDIARDLGRSLELYNFQSPFPVQQLFITGELTQKHSNLNIDLDLPVKKGIITGDFFQQESEKQHQLEYSTAMGLALGWHLNV